MLRSLVSLTAAIVLLVSPSSQAQAPAAPGQGAPTPVGPGVQRPGLPARDNGAQSPQIGTGRIRGRVLVAGTNAPLRRVQMQLIWAEGPRSSRLVNTDGEGRYEFVDLPAGTFSLRATKPGYVGLQYGQRRPYENGTSIALAAGQTISSVDFALPRGSVIAGRITDEFGEVMPKVQVQVQRFQYAADGQRRLVTSGRGATDDRGEFRVYELMPGEYVVNASALTNAVITSESVTLPIGDGYPTTFYPGTPNVDQAQAITLGVGEEVSIQFSLTAMRLSRISGTVRDSQGRPTSARVLLLARRGDSLSSSNNTAADGDFTLTGVVPGDYSLSAQQLLPSTDAAFVAVGEAAWQPITVTGVDMTGIGLTTSKGSIISGKVIWDGTAPRMMPNTIGLASTAPRVGATAVDPTGSALGLTNDPETNGAIDADGSFRLGGAFGQLLFAMSSPPGWTVRSITLDGQDITDKPLDVTGRQGIEGVRITMTDRLANLSGRVTDARGSAVRQFVVVVQRADEVDRSVAARYVRTVRPDTNGRFELRNVRPGRYVATAIESMEQNRQYSPEFQKELRRGAQEFTIREGENLTLDLRITLGL